MDAIFVQVDEKPVLQVDAGAIHIGCRAGVLGVLPPLKPFRVELVSNRAAQHAPSSFRGSHTCSLGLNFVCTPFVFHLLEFVNAPRVPGMAVATGSMLVGLRKHSEPIGFDLQPSHARWIRDARFRHPIGGIIVVFLHGISDGAKLVVNCKLLGIFLSRVNTCRRQLWWLSNSSTTLQWVTAKRPTTIAARRGGGQRRLAKHVHPTLQLQH
jgi:hypothetical protein